MEKIFNYLKDVRIELTKVAWPTKKQLIAFTLTVIGITFFLALFLGALDSGFVYLLNIFVK